MPDEHFLVVGGTRGIGLALVKYLVSTGKQVSVVGRNPEACGESPLLAPYRLDVVDGVALIATLDQAIERFGVITSAIFLQRYRGDNFETDLAVALNSTRLAIDHLVASDGLVAGGSIVLVSSVAATYVAPEQPLGYHVSKAGLVQLGRYYALKLGQRGIRVNTVSPCVVQKDEAKEFYDRQRSLVDRYAKFIPLGRMGRPDDIARAILFLAGDGASYITGQNLVVDGGLTLRSHESLMRDLTPGE